MARLRHPSCVEVYDVGVTGRGEAFLVMEYVPGRNLHEVLGEEGPPPQRRVARWGRDLAEALEACHEEGVLHRDVKPSNVLLTPEGVVRLTDFGVAHDANARTQLTQGAVGTLLYMAPELLDGAGASPASDVYSLGATLYELISGAPPFPGPSHLELLRQIAGSDPQSLSPLGVHQDLNQVLLKCLSKDPKLRYGSALEAATDLGRFVSGIPVLARAQSPLLRLIRQGWKHRVLIASGLIACLVGAGALLATLSLEGRRARRQALRELGEAEQRLRTSAGRRQLDEAEELLERGRSSVHREDQARAAHLARRLTGLRLLLAAREALERYKGVAGELERLSQPVNFIPPSAASLGAQLEREAEGQWIWGECYSRHLRAYVEVERLLEAAEAYLPRGDLEAAARELETFAGRALSEFWPKEAEAHFERAVGLGDSSSSRARPVVQLRGEGTGLLVSEVGVPCSFALPVNLQLSPQQYRGQVQGAGAVPFNLALSPRRGEVREVEVPHLARSDLPPLMRDQLVGVIGGRPRVGLHLRRTTERVSPYLILRTEVTRELALSYLTHAAGRVRSDGSPLLSRQAAQELRRPLYESDSPRAPCTGLNWLDIRQFLKWLEREFYLAGAPHHVRLPRALEFHFALRADFLWLFPWGSKPDLAQFTRTWSDVGTDARDISPLGVFDLGASVGEICAHVVKARTGYTYLGGSWDGATHTRHVLGAAELGGYLGLSGKDQTSGFRFVVELARRPELGWKQNLPRSLELQEVAKDLLFAGQARQAYEQATKSLQAYNKNVAAWVIRGEARLALGDAWGAWWDCAQALELESDNANPRLWGIYGRAVARSQRWEEAIPICTTALSLNERDFSLYFFRGWSYAELGQFAEAVADLETHQERTPKSPNRRQAQELIKACKESLAQQGLGR